MNEKEWDEKWRSKIVTLVTAKIVEAITPKEYSEILKMIPDEALVAAIKFGHFGLSDSRRFITEVLRERMIKWSYKILETAVEDENYVFSNLAIEALGIKLGREMGDSTLEAMVKNQKWQLADAALQAIKERKLRKRYRKNLEELGLLPSVKISSES